jgi:REP element-mobilizing transposase RayT
LDFCRREPIMSSHVFHEIYLHLNWHTKDDHPILCGELEELAHTLLSDKARSIKGAFLHQLGGTDTHVHLAVQIEPFVLISDLVQELKGASAREVNKRTGHKALEWQRGYGAVSFGLKNLPWIVDYVAGQREHHAGGRVFPRLESCEPEETSSGQPAGEV